MNTDAEHVGTLPDDHVAVKLEIHHVVEGSLGGLTVESNLLTLCQSCHETASPPDSWLRTDFFEKIEEATRKFHRRSYAQGVEAYRRRVIRGVRSSLTTFLDDPLDILEFQDVADQKLQEEWRHALLALTGNQFARYFTLSEWRRLLPLELRAGEARGLEM